MILIKFRIGQPISTSDESVNKKIKYFANQSNLGENLFRLLLKHISYERTTLIYLIQFRKIAVFNLNSLNYADHVFLIKFSCKQGNQPL